MSISRDTFDPSKGYKRLRFHQRRDLLDSELNEQQDIALHERRQLFDVLVPQGAIAQGLVPTVTGAQVTLTAGQVYCDGHLLTVPGAVLEYDPGKTSGIDYVWLEVLRLAIDADQDSTLVNPMTGEPAAEREQWLVTLKNANTGGDALPAHGLGRTTVALYAFNRGTAAITPTVAAMLSAQDKVRLDAHIGAGGSAHPTATPALAGFMSAGDKAKLDDVAASATVGQRVATVVVAASDASPAVKAAADVVCTGTNDQAVILQAINALPAIPDACASIELTDRTPDGGHILVRAVHPGLDGNAITIAFVAGEALTVTINQTAIQVTYPASVTVTQLVTAINQAAGDLVYGYVVKYGPLPMLPAVPQPFEGGTLSRSGVVALSEGTFYIYQPISQTNISRLTLSGHQSILRLVDSSYQWGVEDATMVFIGCACCTIEGLIFVGVGGANELDGILFTGTEMVIRDCTFFDSGQNAVDAQGDRNAIVNCVSRNAGSYFVIVRQGDHCQVSGCRSDGDAGGIALTSCDQSLISGNVIANTVSLPGISLSNARGITVSGNVIAYPATAGVEVASGQNVQVIGNQVLHAASDAARWGVRFTGIGDYALVSGNLLVCPANQFEYFESGQYGTKLAGSGLNLRHSNLG